MAAEQRMEQRFLDQREAGAALGFRNREREGAEFGERREVVRPALAQPRDGEACGEQSACGVEDLALVLGAVEVEAHGATPAAGRARARR